jgi:CopG family transcriptional regulator, nickel-responsive regulator
MDAELLSGFDRLIRRKGYTNRSEALRDLVRDALVQNEWESDEWVVGTLSLVYDHDTHELAHVLMDLQHEHHRSIVCATHVHLDAHNCLEVLVVRGLAGDVRQIADRLIATRGVKHGHLSCTTTGERLK